MLKRFMRGISVLMGALAGYGIYALVAYIGALAGYDFDKSLPNRERMLFRILAIVLFAIIFFISYPAFVRRTAKFSSNVSHDLKDVSMSTIVSGTIGLVAGLAIASLLTQLFKSVIKNRYIFDIVVIALYLGFGYIGIVVASVKGRDYVSGMRSLLRSQGQDGQGQAPIASGRTSRRHKDTAIPKVLDTSVIIDGRVADIMDAGFLEGPIVIPDFVLVELRHIADSADSLKRTRGRRGLDILNRIQKDYGVEIYNTEGEKALKEIPEVDVKLLRLAQIMNGKVVTNDYNLNKVAAIDEVPVLNINELANCLKPVVIPGETMKVHPVKQGKGHEQSIGYLDDGTMIVVENGAGVIGKTVIIKVTSVIQTSAGRMIFGRVNEDAAEVVED